MTDDIWVPVDEYLADRLLGHDEHLTAALVASQSAGLPAIQVSAPQGRFLELVARILQPRRVLEIGTLGGYSTICLARALPADGELVTLEADSKHAAVARSNLANAGLSRVVIVREGPALQTLPRLAEENPIPFDLVFVDANKSDNAEYFSWALRLSRPGSVIIVDNVVRAGAVLDDDSLDPNVIGTRQLFDLLRKEHRVTATALQTVGSKGYDGFVLARVN